MKTAVKRILALILAGIMLLAVLSCAKEETPSGASAGTPQTNAPSGEAAPDGSAEPENAPPAWPTRDYSDFVMPEETNELTVYSTGMLGLVMNPAVEIFKKLYPDVTVNYKVLGDDEFGAIVETEIPAGKGPDLLFCYRFNLPDPYKVMTTKLFTDINPYFMNDETFRPDDYLEGAMNWGTYRGEKQLVPIEVRVLAFKTSLETLADGGVDPDAIKTFEDFCAACHTYHETYPRNALFAEGGDDDYMMELLYASNMPFLDYENGTVQIDEEKLHTLLDVCKAYHAGKPHKVGMEYTQISGLFERMYLCSNSSLSPFILLNDMTLITRGEGETPYLLSVPSVQGGKTAEVISYAAVPQASQNKLNAYRLLRILLSEDIQSGRGGGGTAYIRIGMPVRKASIADQVTEDKNRFYAELPYSDEDAQQIIDYCTSVQSAALIPKIIERYLSLEMMPYVRGDKPWDDCYKRFLNTLELYVSE